MEFGKWELRNNDYTGYYFSKDSMIFPSSNAIDQGKLNTEENVRNIYRDLTKKNFVTKYNYFSLSLNPNRNGVIISPGEAVIQGYHFYAKNSIEVKVPDNTTYTNGIIDSKQEIIPYTLGISLTYDAANHVTGDVVNKEAPVGESEVLSGVYVAWFDECQLECNYDNILVLGRAWVQRGMIVPDGTTLDNDRFIYHGFEADPFKDHRFEANVIEVEVNGHRTTKYDTLRDNMTQIHDALYTYDSMHFPVELIREKRTKPPSFITDIQDYVNHIPDWYTSKYGDYMTGALRFNNLSIDAIREFKKLDVSKDSINLSYTDSVFISPRTYGKLTITSDSQTGTVENSNDSIDNSVDYSVGGTIMSIVPGTYDESTDNNNGYTGIHSALISQANGETGLRIHHGRGKTDTGLNGTTRIVHYNVYDDGQIYSKKNNSSNTSKFIIENIDDTGRKASVNIKNGEIFIDSFTSPRNNLKFKEEINSKDGFNFNGEYAGSGIQFFVSGNNTDNKNNIDFRIDENKISIASHKYENHRTGTRGNNQLGENKDELHYEVGLGISGDNNIKRENSIWSYDIITQSNTDPYMTLGNLRIRSNSTNFNLNDDSKTTTKLNTIELINSKELPYLRIKPRVYSEQYVAEELIQVGTKKYDDVVLNDAQNETFDRIVMKKVGLDDNANFDTNKSITYFEHSYGTNRTVLNKMVPPINKSKSPNFNEISGIYSSGNIGCSSAILSSGVSDETFKEVKVDVYNDNAEWVRFTRFRYDLDKDKLNNGTNDKDHENGRTYGAPYNIEFNTCIANARANQIIWRYNGSKGEQSDTIDNTPPVVLSYVHDNTTKYTNVSGTPGYQNGNGTYETWIDHNGVEQFNPTNKVRDFLMLENAGLSVHGDVNNPSLAGDSINTGQHLGVTIVHGRVYNSVYNDFAETFEKDNIDEVAKPGTLIALNPNTGKYTICDGYENKLIVGIQSNSYAYLAGGNRIDTSQDIINLEHEYFTVAVSGKVWVNVIKDSNIKPGDMLTSSMEKGKATKSISNIPGTLIGKALCEPKYFEKDDEYKVLVLVMTA